MGTPEENKSVFDRLPKLIAEKYNAFVDAVAAKFKNYYTKTEVDTTVADLNESIDGKLDQMDVYTKDEVDTEFAEHQKIYMSLAVEVEGLKNNNAGYVTGEEVEELIPDSLPASDVYPWAKEPVKPSYTKSEVGLDKVDNVKQYSASNEPPYPVRSVNGLKGDVIIETSKGRAMRRQAKISALQRKQKSSRSIWKRHRRTLLNTISHTTF